MTNQPPNNNMMKTNTTNNMMKTNTNTNRPNRNQLEPIHSTSLLTASAAVFLKTSKQFLSVAVGAGVVMGLVTSAVGAIPVPTGLNPGDKYHLAFVSSTSRNALSSNIADYDAFVQTAANAAGIGNTEGVTWYVIASTSTVDAKDHAVVGAATPVYLLNGTTKVADNYADMWDVSLDNAINLQENGVTTYGSSGTQVFTGSDLTGGIKSPWGEWLGNGSWTAAGNSASTTRWMDAPGTPTGDLSRPFYALSQELTVPGGGTYASWAGEGVNAFDADANNDGVDNGMAWVLGAANKEANAYSPTSLLPTLNNTDSTYFIFNYNRLKSCPDTTIKVQYCSDLATWLDAVAGADIIINTGTGTGTIDSVEVKIKRTLAVGDKLFARLNVVKTP
jgi:hypothetical protein